MPHNERIQLKHTYTQLECQLSQQFGLIAYKSRVVESTKPQAIQVRRYYLYYISATFKLEQTLPHIREIEKKKKLIYACQTNLLPSIP